MRKLLFLIIFCFIFVNFSACFKINIPTPVSINIIKNGEKIFAEKGSSNYTLEMENITKILSQSLVLRKKEKTNEKEIENEFKTSLNAYKLNYSSISNMKIYLSGNYTDEINFNEIYIIRKVDVHYIYFILKGDPFIYPYIPASEVVRLPR